MSIGVTNTVDLAPFFSALDQFEAGLQAGVPVVLDGLMESGDIYMDAMRRRFLRNSAGGGDWRPLAQSTIRAKGNNRINRDTDELLRSLTPGAPGNVRQIEKPGTLHVGTSVPHAVYVQADRPVFVEPDPPTRTRMDDAIGRAVDAFIAQVFGRAA